MPPIRPLQKEVETKQKNTFNLTSDEINQSYQLFQNRQYTREEAIEYMGYVNSGDVPLPEDSTLNIPTLSKEDADAYRSGSMSLEEQGQLQIALDEGVVKLPEGQGFFAGIKEAITGAERSTPEIEALPDWSELPEKNQFNMDAFLSAIGTISTDPQETAQIIKAGFPGVEVRQDEKGNYILKSAIDQQEYAIKPGFRPSDIPRAAVTAAAFTPAGRATTLTGQVLGAAGTQTAIEASQAALGGEFDPGQVAAAGGLAGAGFLGGKVISAGNIAVRRAYRGFTGKKIPPLSLPEPDIVELTKKAAQGDKAAIKKLAERVKPDPKVIASAKRLGIDEYLQPDHISTNQQFREMSQSIKTVPASTARKLELEGYEAIGKRADDLITEIGGTTDLSKLDQSVKIGLKQVQNDLDDVAEKLYAQVNKSIPSKTNAPATNLLKFINQRSKDFGGAKFLDPVEKKLLQQLGVKTKPTYARLDNLRKQLTLARVKGQGAFKDGNLGLIKKLEQELLKDQQAIALKMGVGDSFDLARKAVAMRKATENDITSIFGKQFDRDLIEGSLVTKLSTATKKLAEGDVSKMKALLDAVPDNMKQEVMTSGIATAFNRAVGSGKLNFNTFANWYEGIMKNSEARKFLLSNLPKEARKRLSDLYRVSKAISKASKERVPTGRTMTDRLRSADSFMSKVYNFVKRGSIPALGVEYIGQQVGYPGLGAGVYAGLAVALRSGAKKDIMLAADELLTSPAFISAVHSGNAGKFVKTRAWKTFFNAMGRPRELSNPEQWILSAFQAGKNIKE